MAEPKDEAGGDEQTFLESNTVERYQHPTSLALQIYVLHQSHLSHEALPLISYLLVGHIVPVSKHHPNETLLSS